MTLTVMSEGTLKIPAQCITTGIDKSIWHPLIPTDAHDHFTAGMNVVHIATPDRSILLDTGVGQPHPLLTSFTKTFAFKQSASLLTCLSSLGIQPQDITDVIFSHAHDDHIMGSTIERNGQRIPTFPNARFLMMQAEWDHAAHQTHQDSAFCTHLEILENYQRLQLISDAYEVAPGIQITPSPGESPGHAIVRLDSSEQTAFYMGDLFHHPAEILHPDWMWPDRDQNQMLASRHALIDEALKTKAILIGAHFTFPGMGSLQQTGSSIQWIPIPPND